MFDFLKKVFGTKSEKDIKGLEGKVEEINSIFNSLAAVSNDELRARSAALKTKITAGIKPENDNIQTIRTKIASDQDMDVNTKEELYKEIDEIEKEIFKKIETVLEELLPEAFAILKETANRFTNNTELEVKATDFDKKLSEEFENIRSEGANVFPAAGCIL